MNESAPRNKYNHKKDFKNSHKNNQDLFWVLGYNIVAIPVATGAFAFLGFFLRPELCALLMSFSTVIVVINALTLKKINLNNI